VSFIQTQSSINETVFTHQALAFLPCANTFYLRSEELL